jgi:hypothetical protein
MSKTTISSQRPSSLSRLVSRRATTSPRAKRLELRVAELDLAHTIEIKRLNTLLATTKQRLFSSGRQRD